MLVDEVARPKKFRVPSGTRLKSTAERRSRAFLGLFVLRTRARDIYTRNARWRARRSTLAAPAKLKLGPALPRACSTDSPHHNRYLESAALEGLARVGLETAAA